MYDITTEQPADWWDVEGLFDLSFAPGREALSSYRLREGVAPVHALCLIARDADGILGGAIRFWPIVIGKTSASALLLGPIAVHPTRQGEGLGGQLMHEALKKAAELNWKRVVLVGDEPYYSRFGFRKAPFLRYPPPTNPDRILYLEVEKDSFDGISGEIKSTISVVN